MRRFSLLHRVVHLAVVAAMFLYAFAIAAAIASARRPTKLDAGDPAYLYQPNDEQLWFVVPRSREGATWRVQSTVMIGPLDSVAHKSLRALAEPASKAMSEFVADVIAHEVPPSRLGRVPRQQVLTVTSDVILPFVDVPMLHAEMTLCSKPEWDPPPSAYLG